MQTWSLSFSKIQIGFTFLVQDDPGSPEKRIVRSVCVCELVYEVKRLET